MSRPGRALAGDRALHRHSWVDLRLAPVAAAVWAVSAAAPFSSWLSRSPTIGTLTLQRGSPASIW